MLQQVSKHDILLLPSSGANTEFWRGRRVKHMAQMKAEWPLDKVHFEHCQSGGGGPLGLCVWEGGRRVRAVFVWKGGVGGKREIVCVRACVYVCV